MHYWHYIHIRAGTPIPADKSASTHVQTGETSTNHEKRVRERCITERTIDGCPLQLTCASVEEVGEEEEEEEEGCTLRASRSRVHATRCPLPPPRLPPPHAKERNDIYPVMDAPSVRRCARYRARRGHVDVTPSTRRPRSQLNAALGVRMRIDVVRRDAFMPGRSDEDDEGLAASSIEASARGAKSERWEARDVIGLMGLVVDAITRLRELHM